MTLVENLEQALFAKGPRILLWVTAIFAFTPLLLIANAILGGSADSRTSYPAVVAVTSLPAILALALHFSVKSRHILTVPLTYVGCALALFSIRDGYGSAFEGIQPEAVFKVVGWIITIAELAFVAFAFVAVTAIWRNGAFKKGANDA